MMYHIFIFFYIWFNMLLRLFEPMFMKNIFHLIIGLFALPLSDYGNRLRLSSLQRGSFLHFWVQQGNVSLMLHLLKRTQQFGSDTSMRISLFINSKYMNGKLIIKTIFHHILMSHVYSMGRDYTGCVDPGWVLGRHHRFLSTAYVFSSILKDKIYFLFSLIMSLYFHFDYE